MLTLKRKTGEEIQIGDRISIVIVSIHQNHIVIGIDAPDEITILRGELSETFPPKERCVMDNIAMYNRIARHQMEVE